MVIICLNAGVYIVAFSPPSGGGKNKNQKPNQGRIKRGKEKKEEKKEKKEEKKEKKEEKKEKGREKRKERKEKKKGKDKVSYRGASV